MSDPYRLLGVPETADDATIRAAYLAAIHACPPERDRSRFEQVRAAYESIATTRDRQARALFDTTAPRVQDILQALTADWRPGRPDEQRLRRVLSGK